ncbi:hypothetical protein KCP73_01880 [Salmonella enterica subsp. enterica]|nr:hypothetical protein KCP73_01880 [Salmonella enterica subsp. enterica]
MWLDVDGGFIAQKLRTGASVPVICPTARDSVEDHVSWPRKCYRQSCCLSSPNPSLTAYINLRQHVPALTRLTSRSDMDATVVPTKWQTHS